MAQDLERSADRANARGGLAAAAFLGLAAELTPDSARAASRALDAARAKFEAGDPVDVPLLSRQLTADVIVSHGKALRRPPGGPEEEFLYTRVYVNDAGAWSSSQAVPGAAFAFGRGICWDARGRPSVLKRRRGPR